MFGSVGPIIAVALIGVMIVGYLMIQSSLWGFIGLIGVITLLPYATLPFKIVFTPTFLDLILAAIFVMLIPIIWIAMAAFKTHVDVYQLKL